MIPKHSKTLAAALLLAAFPFVTFAQPKRDSLGPIRIGAGGAITYTADAKGDRVPDYSYCGYRLSEVPIPDVPVKVIVPPLKGDATGSIQAAIDYVSSLPLSKEGFR